MDLHDQLRTLLLDDPRRRRVFEIVRALDLLDGWLAAGFIRNAVWDRLHGQASSSPWNDVDVLWFEAADTDPETDRRIEARLREREPTIPWSVKNQARMHGRNGDAPYSSTRDAMRYWCETATAVAARLSASGELEIAAPFGLEDLFAMIIRPGPRFIGDKRAIYRARVARKSWTELWPRVRVMDAGA